MKRVKKGEKYWSFLIYTHGYRILEFTEGESYAGNDDFDAECAAFGNYFRTKEEAEAMAKKLCAVLKGSIVIDKLPSEEEIIKAARGRAERHSIAEAELHKGLGNLYGYSRIENAEIASFEAGAEWLKSQLTKEE